MPDIKLAIEGSFLEFFTGEASALKRAAITALTEVAETAKADLRGQVDAARLGKGVSNAWRLEYYPKNKDSLGLAAYIYTKAPNIIDAFNSDQPIVPKNGHSYLAIPTGAVPKVGRGHRVMTSAEVEERFGQKLQFIPDSNGGGVLVLDHIVRAKSGAGFRKATKRRLAQGRLSQQVVMFVLVRQVRLGKRLDVESVFKRAEAALAPTFIAALKQQGGSE